jgi:Bifunctional DNA primase/polymerase, N-terminal
MTEVGEAALAYATAGYAVFPLRGKQPFGNCRPASRVRPATDPTRHPTVGMSSAMGYTHPPPTLAGWAAGGGRWPQANIGARVPANPLVVDLDPRHGGLGRLAELEREHGPLPATRVSISGRGDGGQHRWFCTPAGGCRPPCGAPSCSPAVPSSCHSEHDTTGLPRSVMDPHGALTCDCPTRGIRQHEW